MTWSQSASRHHYMPCILKEQSNRIASY